MGKTKSNRINIMDIKIILLLIFEIFSYSFYSQTKLEGHFIADNNNPLFAEYHEEFFFHKNGRVFYYEHTDIGNNIGYGKYRIDSCKLSILFDTIPQTITDTLFQKVNITNESTSDSDIITYKCLVKDNKNYVLEEAIIRAYEFKDSAQGKIITEPGCCETNHNGAVRFQIHKKQLPIIIVAAYVGYKLNKIVINDDKSKIITFKMGGWFHKIDINTVQEYTIKNVKDDSFVLNRFHFYDDWEFVKED